MNVQTQETARVTELFGMSWRKMMMWLLIVTDALLFAGFLAAYGFNRLASDAWPDRSKIFDINFITAMTFVLITSSATMASAVTASRLGRRSTALKFLGLTLLGGVVFLGMQAYEWTHLIEAGARLTGNPWGPRGFSSFFFIITGFHGTHVLVGAIILAVAACLAAKDRITPDGVELAGLYWHFVDLVWVFVFGTFYLI